ncbi:MAG: hypothetical protein IKG00_08705 [Lachnospiraceae bacterium]|jgi:hypothetical protein|nr:hypothetical protein [Clostridia bacterium]MBR2842287.1 hypothetical protein [Lachnospiraceae bacterium]MBR3241659.1 hypothetical protein [Parasporobacterium sp.]MBR3309957.1 hypothetical protein [Lachnospiraceae bacterium]
MAETLRELVVALSLDSSNFSRNMRTINQQIKEAEPTFRLAGAGVENYEKTIAGTEAKLSMLGNKLTQQQRAGRHVFMTESRWHSSVDECQRRKFSEKFTRICYHWNREPLLGINRQP